MEIRTILLNGRTIEYRIFDPTGNITALVESQADPADQPAIASMIMERHPDVEQVGFVMFAADENEGSKSPDAEVPVSLRMTGGEFCGNATMCAAALYMIKNDLTGSASVKVKVSGARGPLEVKLKRTDTASFDAAVTMPPALDVGTVTLLPDDPAYTDGTLEVEDEERIGSEDGINAMITLPLVRMEGIDHIIIEPDSGFFGLKDDKDVAESMLRRLCKALDSDCLGMMFISETSELMPLVYVPGADTMFWENSCASGSAAAGIYLASKAGKPVDVTFSEPAGRLRVSSDPGSGSTVLYGSLTIKE